jgi:hypothetical protein
VNKMKRKFIFEFWRRVWFDWPYKIGFLFLADKVLEASLACIDSEGSRTIMRANEGE